MPLLTSIGVSSAEGIGEEEGRRLYKQLVEKYDGVVRQERLLFSEDLELRARYRERQLMREEDRGREWFCGEPSLTMLDGRAVGSLLERVPERVRGYLRRMPWDALGLCVFSLGETNLFEGVEIGEREAV